MYDLCLKLAAAGGECWLEPGATLFYDRPHRIDDADRELYMLRWSRAWDTGTLDRFAEAWDLDPNDPDREFTQYWHAYQRRLAYVPAKNKWESLRRKRRALADSTYEAAAVARDRVRRRAAGGSTELAAPARVAHAPPWASASAESIVTY